MMTVDGDFESGIYHRWGLMRAAPFQWGSESSLNGEAW